MANEAADKELKKLTAIIRLHQSIGASLDMEKICRISVRELVDAMGCDICAIMLIKENKVKVIAGKCLPKMLSETDIDAYAPALKQIISTKQDIVINDMARDATPGCVPRGWSVDSVICAPILVKEEVKGIIHLGFMEKNAFSQEGLELVRLMAKDISIALERSLLYSQTLDLSIRDGLTGCFNRRKFDTDIVAEIAEAKSYGEPISLLMVDIDWFKQYNDFHGHPKGDTLLKQIAHVLTANVRALDTVYRYGGEEFAILLPKTDKSNALLVAHRLQARMEKKRFEGEIKSQPKKKMTISIGLASFPADASTDNELIKAADSALYKAKQAGRNQVCVFQR